MRKWIIDTDTASDDSCAIMLAALSPDIEILGVTAVAGNVCVEQAADNALMTLEVCGCDAPVFLGAKRPMLRERKDTISVHGKDGMGDMDIIHPTRRPEKTRAVDFILDTVAANPDEVELIVLGPATNVALAILTDREIMSHVKHIWSMGTPGFGPGNATPVAEFNVFIDAEAYSVMLDSGIPVTIAGFDLCTGEIGFDKKELAILEAGNAPGKFLEKATKVILQFNIDTRGAYLVDLPDAIAVAAALWDDFVTGSVECFCTCSTLPGETYGQVIMYRKGSTYESMPAIKGYNSRVISSVSEEIFTTRAIRMLSGTDIG